MANLAGGTMLFFGLCGFFLTSLYTYALLVATEKMPERRDLIVTSFMVLGEVGFLLSNYAVVTLIGACGIGAAPLFFLVAGSGLLLTLGAAYILSLRRGRGLADAVRPLPARTEPGLEP
jgi:hypothetical protein